ncbi:ankyrin repeat and MYND domain-containing protein 1 [Protopterus annectens]|uniref:ankyrin repeat and MYND domain-containing protein 1 n=1 Tax=Protopterus annectens TaxID=7888 RepID=UPI001CFA2A41|nr:ankyrin repeat and MYND domain-containing protein 1 [Protopterus annectens]
MVLKNQKQASEEVVKYTGDELNDMKHGHGLQEWPDGTRYEGQFKNDLKHGTGTFIWANGEVYIGEFYKDHRHGKGTYKWPDGSVFTGSFYLSQKEGYGALENEDGTKYEGLYKADERFGPGVFTYTNSCQDVGLWHRNYLIQLCTKLPESFSLQNYPEYEHCLNDHAKKINVKVKANGFWNFDKTHDPFFYRYKELLKEDYFTLPENIETYSNDTEHLPLTLSFKEECDQQFFQSTDSSNEGDEEFLVSKNNTPLLVDMQLQVYKHRNSQAELSWEVDSVLKLKREAFLAKGLREQISEQLIEEAAQGNYKIINEILRNGLIHVDVADSSGYGALHAAAVNCHNDIINLLLDNGADVNRLTDEGVSALTACLVLYYSPESFHHNIAERSIAISQVKVQKHSTQGKETVLTLASSQNESVLTNLPEQNQVKSSAEVGTDVESYNKLKSSSRQILTNAASQGGNSSLKENEKTCSLTEQIESDSGLRTKIENEEHDSAATLSSGTGQLDSNQSVRNIGITMSQSIMQQSAKFFSHLIQIPTRSSAVRRQLMEDQGTVRKMAFQSSEHRRLRSTIKLLLSRGADPNSSSVPMHALFFAIKAADTDAVRMLLQKGARTDIQLSSRLGGLTPLHIAVALPGEEGVKITELLLHACADPDVRAEDVDDTYAPDRGHNSLSAAGFSFTSANISFPPSFYDDPPKNVPEEGGRTPLHIACERDNDYMNARDIIRLLLAHNANPNVLWSGHSPLSLAIASGNDLAIDELLKSKADPNLQLTKGVGSSLCCAVNTAYELRRTLQARIALVDKLIKAGGNILMPITLGHGKRSVLGTAVDYGYYKFFQDQRIAHTPYHALSLGERDIYNARKQLLDRMGTLLREAVVLKEKQRLLDEVQHGIRSKSPSERFLYTGAGAVPSVDDIVEAKKSKGKTRSRSKSPKTEPGVLYRKPLFKYCYQCGRSVGVKLAVCTRCQEVFYCNKYCKVKAWNEWHKDECIRLIGKDNYGAKGRRTASPDEKKNADKDKEKKDHIVENYSFN